MNVISITDTHNRSAEVSKQRPIWNPDSKILIETARQYIVKLFIHHDCVVQRNFIKFVIVLYEIFQYFPSIFNGVAF